MVQSCCLLASTASCGWPSYRSCDCHQRQALLWCGHLERARRAPVKRIDVIFNQPQPFAGLQTYTLDLDACVVVGDMCMKIPDASAPFTDGRFIDTGSNQGSMFLPRASEPRNPINELLKIQWCPDQNYFLVKFAGQLLEPLRQQPTVFSTVSPHPNTNDPNDYLGSRCIEIPPFGSPPLVPQCGSASAPPSGLACNCITITGTCNCVTTPCNCIGILERLCTCQPRVYFLNTVCNPKFVGTCGSSSYPSSGLSCQCSEVSIGPKKACTCQP